MTQDEMRKQTGEAILRAMKNIDEAKITIAPLYNYFHKEYEELTKIKDDMKRILNKEFDMLAIQKKLMG